MMTASACMNDNTMGPGVRGCRGDFDFTQKFERVFLSIVPASLFVASSLCRVVSLVKKPQIISGGTHRFIKMNTIAVFITLKLVLLVLSALWYNPNDDSLAIAAATVGFIAAVFIQILSFFEHTRAPRPSTLLTCYILPQIMFDIAQVRTLWMIARNQWIAGLFTASLGVEITTLILEVHEKVQQPPWSVKDHSPEETSGLINLGLYFWLNTLFFNGYRSLLSIEELYPLDQSMRSRKMQQTLDTQLEKSLPHGKKMYLADVLAKAFAVPFLLPVLPRLALIGFKISQPFFIESLLNHLQHSDAPHGAGYGLIGAATLIYSGIATSNALYMYFHQRVLHMARGALVTAIYRTTLVTKSTDAGSAAVTLMSTDIERAMRGFTSLHEFWASSVEAALACWLLERKLGVSFVAPIVVLLVCTVAVIAAGRYTGDRQRTWMTIIEKRVKITAEIISNMKHLRISSIAGPVGEIIQKMRETEIDSGNRFRWLLIVTAVVALIPDAVSPVFTLAFTSTKIDTTTIFVSISLLNLLSAPLGQLFQALPGLIAGFVCLERIQEFLEADAHVDFRQRIEISSEESSNDGTLLDLTERYSVLDVATQSPVMDITSNTALVRGSFSWSKESTALDNISAQFPTSRLTIVTGPVASGKSTLCKALLGEIPIVNGQVFVSTAGVTVGYCDQIPFLFNGSIKENIVGHSQFIQSRYDEVVNACMLRKDILHFPDGDATKTGSNGIMLSGGQKQRVSLARALYLESDFLIVDDILSSLDSNTAAEIFLRIFGPTGIIKQRKATAVLCTNVIQFLSSADHIIVLGLEGMRVGQGTLKRLRDKKHTTDLSATAACSAPTPTSASGTYELNHSSLSRVPEPRHIKSVVECIEEKHRQIGDTTVYLHYVRSASLWSLITCLVTSLLYTVSHNFPTIWVNYWANDSFRRSGQFYIGLYGLFQTLQLFSIFGCCVTVIIWITTQCGVDMHHQALGTVIQARLDIFTATDFGFITSLFSQDMTLIDGALPFALLNTVINAFDALGMAVVIAAGTPYVAVGYPFFLLSLYIIQKLYLRTSRQLRLLDLEAKSLLYTHFLDTVRGIITHRAFRWTDKDSIDNQQLLDTSQRPSYLLAMVQQWLTLIMQLFVTFIAVTVVALATQIESSSNLAGASLLTLMSLGETIGSAIRFYTQLESSIGAVARIRTFSDMVASEQLEEEDIEPPEIWPENGEIRIRGVSASYGNNDEKRAQTTALKNINISIPSRHKVAICGRTGSGKSSLILLLLHLIEPLPSCSKNIDIDDIPLHRINRSILRQRIIAVPQDVVFLPEGSTIKENIDPLGSSSDLNCLEVLRMVQLSDLIGEGDIHAVMYSNRLSAGQKQLFSLGRAILRRRAKDMKLGEKCYGGILLMDETNSNIDSNTDKIMQKIIMEEFSEYTVVMVLHRLDTAIKFFNTVVVMDEGCISEMGSPAKLLATEGSLFSRISTVEVNKGA